MSEMEATDNAVVKMEDESVAEVDSAVDRNQHTKEMLEKEKHAQLIKIKQLEELGYQEFAKWLKSIARYGNIHRTMLLYKFNDQDRVAADFFTNDYKYSIHAARREYLGAYASCRKSRVGETWLRGSDLPDGKYNKETFDNIVKSIVGYEMKNLQCWCNGD